MLVDSSSLDTKGYAQHLELKCNAIREHFSEFELPDIEVFESQPEHFRMRAEFKIWHENTQAYYAMYKPGEYKKPYKIAGFPAGSITICELMPPLLEAINASEVIRQKLFQVEFLTTTTGDALISLIYHRALDNIWIEEASALQSSLKAKIIGRSRKQKLVLSEDFVIESFEVNGAPYYYQQVETGFTQPNAGVCQKMLAWAQSHSHTLGGDLLELYCGNGNFTIPLAKNFTRVLATEVSKTSVRSANYNIALNNTHNIHVVRLSSEEFGKALDGVRKFRRLEGVELSKYEFSTVFVDPPRAGLDSGTNRMISGFDNILYISCNPTTLRDNLRQLIQTHDIQAFAFFDQFPYTPHCECGVMLRRRG